MPSIADMLDAINTCARLDDEFELSEWEENFLISVEDQFLKGLQLSQLQVQRLESIYERT